MYQLKFIRITINLSNFIRIQFYMLQHIQTILKVIQIELLFSLRRHSYYFFILCKIHRT
ncbi:hypothetical protein GIB67_025913 [Kingdonia uniflora]|uniref:Uncharacterized protein n=1 Tax=Kingdonia uniflora TaxID=39325 RepID=A0A7J7NZQ9_9MAGN|nr:hypothetical protein GIB67_025913 [Kingdonia uniflora]